MCERQVAVDAGPSWRVGCRRIVRLLCLGLALLPAVACIALRAGASAAATPESEADYSAWAVDPSAPGSDLPPIGRSLFDHLFSEREGNRSAYRLPFPFSALIERVQARLTQAEFGGGTRIAIFPMGRSLQRSAAAPEFFDYPRVVFAVTGEPIVGEHDAGVLLKDRLYLGYVEKTATLEVVSYNEAAGRFEFQLVKDYRAGATPRVFYANRAICIACHQNHAPIFSRAIWGESNANGRVAELLRAHGKDMQLSTQANIDFPDDIDKSTVRANALVTLQSVWQRGCADEQDGPRARRCRAAALGAILQYGLSGEQDFDATAAAFRDDFVATLAATWRRRWPNGLSLAESSLPDRNPLGGATPTYGGGGVDASSADWIAASNVPAQLDPLNPRPAREVLSFASALDGARLISGWAKVFAADDFRMLDAFLVSNRAHAHRTTYSTRCSLQRRASGTGQFKIDCPGEPSAARSVSLAGRIEDSGGGRIDWLSLGQAGRLRDLSLVGEAVRRHGSMRVARATPQSKPLAPRLSDGSALERIELRWPIEGKHDERNRPVDAQLEVVVVDDFAPVRQAIDRMLTRQPALLGDAPLARGRLLRALFAELGMPQRSWCCVDDRALPPAQLDPPEVDTSAINKPQLAPFFRACAMCHLTRERFPPDFLAGNADDIERNLRRCAPRMWIRLAAWNVPPEQRIKSPMPPVTALPALGTSTHAWATGAELARLRAYVEALGRDAGSLPEADALANGDYEKLPPCLAAR